METIDLINGLNEAYRILIKARMESASDAACIWNKLNHAADRINRQIEELLAPPPEPVVHVITCNATGDLTCTCGNVPSSDGFVPVDEATRQECEPIEGEWNGRYLCQSCGATIVLDDGGRTAAGSEYSTDRNDDDDGGRTVEGAITELESRIFLLYRAGRSPNQIAHLCGITLSDLRAALIRNGVTVKW